MKQEIELLIDELPSAFAVRTQVLRVIEGQDVSNLKQIIQEINKAKDLYHLSVEVNTALLSEKIKNILESKGYEVKPYQDLAYISWENARSPTYINQERSVSCGALWQRE